MKKIKPILFLLILINFILVLYFKLVLIIITISDLIYNI